ncbi:MAG: tetratricopeptide repeat protein, partial [Roseiflexaceae bacterium]|nr:tetratricopeptide repeat protein [Roseiflexaceae bacterium]
AALESYQQALRLFREIGAKLGEANVRKAIGDVQQFRKETSAALESYQQALRLFREIGAKLGEANVLAALSCLRLDDDPADSRRLLEQALALRRAIGSVYDEAVDLGNYGIALLQRGRGAEALPYLERARDLFASRGLTQQAEQAEQLIAKARTAALLGQLPPAVRAALEAQDQRAFNAAVAALPPEEQQRIGTILQALAGAVSLPDPLAPFEPLLAAIASVARGDAEQRPAVEAALAELETKGWMLRAPVTRIWQGERDLASLIAGLDEQDAALIRRVLELIG